MNYKRVLIVFVVFLIFSFLTISGFSVFEVEKSSMRNTLLDGDFILARNANKDIKKGNIYILKFNETLLIKRCIANSGDIVHYSLDSVFVNNELVKFPQSAVHEFVTDQRNEKILLESLDEDKNFFSATDILFDFKNQKVYMCMDTESFNKIKKYHFNVKKSERNIYNLPRNDSFVVPIESFFFIGDNMEHSHDSRHFGSIHKQNVIGEAVFILFSYHNGRFHWNRFFKRIE